GRRWAPAAEDDVLLSQGARRSGDPLARARLSAIQRARTREIGDRREGGEERHEHDGREHEHGRVADGNGLDGELPDATPVEEELDDREARDGYAKSAAERLEEHRPRVRQ